MIKMGEMSQNDSQMIKMGEMSQNDSQMIKMEEMSQNDSQMIKMGEMSQNDSQMYIFVCGDKRLKELLELFFLHFVNLLLGCTSGVHF